MTADLHSRLCDVAATWLSGRWNCAVVAVEPRAWAVQEEPDAFGWDINGISHLVEVKVSLDDFMADRYKAHRGMEGMGTFRWYLAPKGVIPVEKLPPYWGLATVSGSMKRVVIKRPAWDRPFTDTRARLEAGLLACLVRRSHDYEKVLRVDGEMLQGMALARRAPFEGG
ncbi:MAG: hypothetical protein E4H01_09525 [Lysobacterales bacterium]|nr:MAG: hypothetical protein E4H01_09525 [Xanthomonadales bacterium]